MDWGANNKSAVYLVSSAIREIFTRSEALSLLDPKAQWVIRSSLFLSVFYCPHKPYVYADMFVEITALSTVSRRPLRNNDPCANILAHDTVTRLDTSPNEVLRLKNTSLEIQEAPLEHFFLTLLAFFVL